MAREQLDERKQGRAAACWTVTAARVSEGASTNTQNHVCVVLSFRVPVLVLVQHAAPAGGPVANSL